MKIQNANYYIVEKWFNDCSSLVDLFSDDNSLTMDVEWAIYQNYKYLKSALNSVEKQKQALEEKFGSLQPDGSYKLDTTSDIAMGLYEKELNQLMQSNIKVYLEKIDHKALENRPGVTLGVISLFDFMIC